MRTKNHLQGGCPPQIYINSISCLRFQLSSHGFSVLEYLEYFSFVESIPLVSVTAPNLDEKIRIFLYLWH